jgi:hypothetical protein
MVGLKKRHHQTKSLDTTGLSSLLVTLVALFLLTGLFEGVKSRIEKRERSLIYAYRASKRHQRHRNLYKRANGKGFALVTSLVTSGDIGQFLVTLAKL